MLYQHCSIPKLLHPLFFEYQSYFLENHKEREEVILFLSMVKLQQKRLAWALHQKEGGKKNKELLPHLGIKLRRFQQLCVEYRKTGQVPTLIPQRRPKTYLRAEQKELIRKAAEKVKYVEQSRYDSTYKNIMASPCPGISFTPSSFKKAFQGKMRRKRSKENTADMKENIVFLSSIWIGTNQEQCRESKYVLLKTMHLDFSLQETNLTMLQLKTLSC